MGETAFQYMHTRWTVKSELGNNTLVLILLTLNNRYFCVKQEGKQMDSSTHVKIIFSKKKIGYVSLLGLLFNIKVTI